MISNRPSIGKILPKLGLQIAQSGSNTFELFHNVSLIPHLGCRLCRRLCSAFMSKNEKHSTCQMTGQ